MPVFVVVDDDDDNGNGNEFLLLQNFVYMSSRCF